MPLLLTATVGALFGAILGSWIAACCYRIPRGIGVHEGRSQCTACAQPISGWWNIPIVSWIVLRGRSRCCGTPLSKQYLLVEAGGATGGALVALVSPLLLGLLAVILIVAPVLYQQLLRRTVG